MSHDPGSNIDQCSGAGKTSISDFRHRGGVRGGTKQKRGKSGRVAENSNEKNPKEVHIRQPPKVKFKMIQVDVVLVEDKCQIQQNQQYFCYFCEKIKKYIPSEPTVEYLCDLLVIPWTLVLEAYYDRAQNCV